MLSDTLVFSGSTAPAVVDTKINQYHEGTVEPTNETLAALGFSDGDETKAAIYRNTTYDVDFKYSPNVSGNKWSTFWIYKNTTLSATSWQDAIETSHKYRVRNGVELFINLSGTTANNFTATKAHPDAERITYRGNGSATPLRRSDILMASEPADAAKFQHASTPVTTSSRLLDLDAVDTYLQGKFSTIVNTQSTIISIAEGRLKVENIYFRAVQSDGTTRSDTVNICQQAINGAVIVFSNCSALGFANSFIANYGSKILASNSSLHTTNAGQSGAGSFIHVGVTTGDCIDGNASSSSVQFDYISHSVSQLGGRGKIYNDNGEVLGGGGLGIFLGGDCRLISRDLTVHNCASRGLWVRGGSGNHQLERLTCRDNGSWGVLMENNSNHSGRMLPCSNNGSGGNQNVAASGGSVVFVTSSQTGTNLTLNGPASADGSRIFS